MSKKKPEDLKIGNVAPFGLRMQPDLKTRIEIAASDNNRSMNSEIVARLEASFDRSKSAPTESMALALAVTKQLIVTMVESGVLASKTMTAADVREMMKSLTLHDIKTQWGDDGTQDGGG